LDDGLYQTVLIMNRDRIQKLVDSIDQSNYAFKTDKQLASYEDLSLMYKQKYAGRQPPQLRGYKKRENGRCKLNEQLVAEIRNKYQPHVYGKLKLAKEYGVSTSVIYRIIKKENLTKLFILDNYDVDYSSFYYVAKSDGVNDTYRDLTDENKVMEFIINLY